MGVVVGVQVAEEALIIRSFGIPLALASLQAKKEKLDLHARESCELQSLDITEGLSLRASVATRPRLRRPWRGYLRTSASSNDSVEIPSSPLSPLSSSSDSSPSEPSPSPQYSLPNYEEEAQDANDNESPQSECTLERQIFGGNSPVYLPMMATNKGSVGSDEGIPLSHMIYLLGNKSGVEDTDEEMSEDQGSILMDIDANHCPPPVKHIPVAPDAPRMQFCPEPPLPMLNPIYAFGNAFNRLCQVLTQFLTTFPVGHPDFEAINKIDNALALAGDWFWVFYGHHQYEHHHDTMY
ncbi:hypothetical protein PTTG_25472 [Puccinia triticina 1-1 BBBD Race 1]|uniref:Uncharacterized protein n=1 Tax=Puccinia triticina (isolate 1-1 / race 1 (BBBD)) TaxID=630390 RepID=A0A180H2F2_PUCT1|nr:hypothetical protein PTTG_25472 [Puccinia triticina 1-1 BBBD Race 1]